MGLPFTDKGPSKRVFGVIYSVFRIEIYAFFIGLFRWI
jgi:hypothetical protein